MADDHTIGNNERRILAHMDIDCLGFMGVAFFLTSYHQLVLSSIRKVIAEVNGYAVPILVPAVKGLTALILNDKYIIPDSIFLIILLNK